MLEPHHYHMLLFEISNWMGFFQNLIPKEVNFLILIELELIGTFEWELMGIEMEHLAKMC